MKMRMNKIKMFFIRFFRIPLKIYIVWDRENKVYNLWTGKYKSEDKHRYTNIRALKGGLYNTLVCIKDRPFDILCSRRILNRLFEPDRDKFDI